MADPRILFMTNLTPKLATSEKLYELCGEFGSIRQIRLGNEAETRLTAIVIYELCESAELALKTLHDRQISKTKFLHVTVFDEAREKKMLEKRKRLRGREQEYREHIQGAAAAAAK
jgi:pre-mRNA branch site protein p14